MLHSSRKLSTNQIAKELKLDLSTIQRSMKKMADKKIVSRTQINLESGGYNLVYCICNKEEIKNLIKESIKNWSNKFKEEIERW
jgi:predicted transcriptional regulator